MGGFECATHQRQDRAQLDLLRETGHDRRAAEDYRLLATTGVHTVRDGLRWHRIEQRPGVYDWSSFMPMLDAAIAQGTQVIWDLCHWGVPAGLDPFSAEFPERLARFAAAAAALVLTRKQAAGDASPSFYCAINEISFWAWVGGDVEHFAPFGKGRGPELKRRLVAASIAAMRAIRLVDPAARFLHIEPLIHISAQADRPEDAAEAAGHTASQYEVWDMTVGRRDLELGGDEAMLDLLGVNYYWNNQWEHEGDRTPPGHRQHRPLHLMLEEVWKRYGRQIVLTETGTEGAAAAGWLGYICAEVRQAMRLGVPVLGICLYPVMDYPGWDDGRHCRCGLIAVDDRWDRRTLREDLCAELAVQEAAFRGVNG